jgi:glycosyltransferase involved in cell wall biosynthesis
MDSLKISVLMPAYNAEKYISEAIESILNQTFKDFEFIVIDDCSTDGTGKIINRYAAEDPRIIFLRNESNLKISKTLNRGIDIARGKYIARMDADDWSYPDRLQKQFDFMEKNPEVGVSGGAVDICNEQMKITGRRKYNLSDSDIRKKIFRYNPFAHSAIIIRKDVLQKSGLYDNDYNLAEDYELYFRIGRYAKFANLEDVLLKYRIFSGSSTGKSTKKMELATIKARNKHLSEYNMGLLDGLYKAVQYFSIFLIPAKLKIKLFNFFRS